LNRIAAYIDERGIVSVAELCEHFEVSEATIRRDLDALARNKRIQRIHGGARKLQSAPPELPVLQRSNEQSEEKVRIGRAVAELIEDGDTIFIGSGSTAFEVARSLGQTKRLTVVSNSLMVINELIHYANIEMISLGGVIRKTELSFIGHLTEQALSQLRTDRVIMGIHAIDVDHGLTNDYLDETITDRTILRSGKQIIIVADHTKCGRVSKAYVAPVEAVHVFVTGVETPEQFAAGLKERGVFAVRV
jgi:DeoR/GlpR family transcriptional regulator of sugar metabolism